MNHDPQPNSRDERHLDEMTAALRDAGVSEEMSPELKRSTLQALWVADAARHERSSARRAGVARRMLRVAAVVAIAGGGVAVASLVSRAWKKAETRNAWNAEPATTFVVPPAEPTVEVYGPARPAVVLGRVTLLGQPPYPTLIDVSATPECRRMHPNGLFDDSLVVGEQRGIANVVVSVERADGGILTGPVPSSPAVLDQRGCQYVPRVLPVTIGQPISVKNSDPFLHNVHSLPLYNPAFNIGQPNIDPGRAMPPMKVAERFMIKCDVHPWMRAYVNVFAHPYFSVTGSDGAFAIPGSLPDGRYTLVAWHEKLGEKRAPVEVKGGRPVVMDFEFSASSLSGE